MKCKRSDKLDIIKKYEEDGHGNCINGKKYSCDEYSGWKM